MSVISWDFNSSLRDDGPAISCPRKAPYDRPGSTKTTLPPTLRPLNSRQAANHRVGVFPGYRRVGDDLLDVVESVILRLQAAEGGGCDRTSKDRDGESASHAGMIPRCWSRAAGNQCLDLILSPAWIATCPATLSWSWRERASKSGWIDCWRTRVPRRTIAGSGITWPNIEITLSVLSATRTSTPPIGRPSRRSDRPVAIGVAQSGMANSGSDALPGAPLLRRERSHGVGRPSVFADAQSCTPVPTRVARRSTIGLNAA
jgi:hypothetical protein